MNSRHNLPATPDRSSDIKPHPTMLSDPGLTCDSSECRVSQEEYETWIHCLDFPLEIDITDIDLKSLRVAVIGGPALDHVTDIQVLTWEAGFLELEIQKLPSDPAKYPACLGLTCPRRFPENHDPASRISITSDAHSVCRYGERRAPGLVVHGMTQSARTTG